MYHTIKFCPQYTKSTYKVSTGITDHSSEQKPEIQLTSQDRKLVFYPMLSLILSQKSLSAEKLFSAGLLSLSIPWLQAESKAEFPRHLST